MPECTILIADDESLARKAIKLQLEKYPGVHVVAECADGAETLSMINKSRPDIIFLDIRMPGLTGLEVLSQLPDGYEPFVIFVTAFDVFALQAFENDAVDYLLKPFTDERFDRALKKALKLWNEKQKHTLPREQFLEQLKGFMEGTYQPTPATVTLTIKDGSKIFIVESKDILFLESTGNYTTVVTTEKKYLYKETLSALEEQLLPVGFIRIHKSYIVSKNHIKELHSHHNGDYTVILKSGHELKLSRNYRDQLLQFLK